MRVKQVAETELNGWAFEKAKGKLREQFQRPAVQVSTHTQQHGKPGEISITLGTKENQTRKKLQHVEFNSIIQNFTCGSCHKRINMI